MSDAFPRVGFFAKGYDVSAVNEFFADAREAYEGDSQDLQLGAAQVQQATFRLKRNGYNIAQVDAAMNRLEAAFVSRDRAQQVAAAGEAAWFEQVAQRATTLYPRLLRPHGERFDQPTRGRGYDKEQVDALLDRLSDYFDNNGTITADEVRQAAFQPRRGKKAYAEGPVDAYLARAVEILLAVK